MEVFDQLLDKSPEYGALLLVVFIFLRYNSLQAKAQNEVLGKMTTTMDGMSKTLARIEKAIDILMNDK